MDISSSIASMAMSYSQANFETNYSMAVTKKMMETEELALQELEQMTQAVQMAPPSPYTFDVRV